MKGLLCSIACCLMFVSAYPAPGSAASIYGYREFKLGQTADEVKKIIESQYAGGKVKYLTGGDIELEVSSDGMVTAKLFFNHVKVLYKIEVAIKYGEVSKVKARLIESYGRPNDFVNEEYYDSDKRFMVGRWFFDRQYRVTLWEGYYCRNQVMIPCVVEVHYMDVRGKEAREAHERKLKEAEQREKDKKTYDGF